MVNDNVEENIMTDEEAIDFAWKMYILNQSKDWLEMFSYLSYRYEKENDRSAIFISSFVIKAERH